MSPFETPSRKFKNTWVTLGEEQVRPVNHDLLLLTTFLFCHHVWYTLRKHKPHFKFTWEYMDPYLFPFSKYIGTTLSIFLYRLFQNIGFSLSSYTWYWWPQACAKSKSSRPNVLVCTGSLLTWNASGLGSRRAILRVLKSDLRRWDSSPSREVGPHQVKSLLACQQGSLPLLPRLGRAPRPASCAAKLPFYF